MRCIKCNSLEDKVIDSRVSKDGFSIRRRRECLECGHRFTTYEQVERRDMLVIKRDGTREPFKREKLLSGLIKACEKRPVSLDTLEEAVDRIVNDLTAESLKELPSRMIGPKVMEHLQKIDPVAFVRYASVYRQFQDVGEFSDVIESLENTPLSDLHQPDLFETTK
ncbi:MAG: transcriptional regulator NrdR [Verrucomicrobiales bacterium]|nr:transcriptional regulator NrdR [Verrucomicrobiales bacterium]MEC5127207.1 transcriptional regulator NrdR [Verrucomicrobiales bacterium BCK34]